MSAPAIAATPDWRAPMAAACGSICVGTVPALAVGLYAEGMQPASLLFWRYWLALCVLVPLAAWITPSLTEDWRRAGPALLVNAIFLGAVQTFCYFRAIKTVPSSVVVTIFFAYPIFTLLIERFWFQRQLARSAIAAAGILLVGVVLTSWPRLITLEGDAIGLMYAVGAAVVFSVYLAISQRYTATITAVSAAAFIYLGLALAFSGTVLINGLDMPQSTNGWLRMIGIATFGGALQICSFAYALPRLSASGYGIIISLELVTVAVIGVLVLGEPLAIIQAVGLAIVVSAILFDRLKRSG
jgi:drug/metabolite transporter (DMT)-like permease